MVEHWFHQILEAIMLCGMALPSKLCAALHGNLMLVQCVIASHAEVWTSQSWWNSIRTGNMVHVPEGKEVSTQGQHYVK